MGEPEAENLDLVQLDGPFINDSLEVLFEKDKPGRLGPEESKVIVGLIRQILQYGFKKQPGAVDFFWSIHGLWRMGRNFGFTIEI